jgi:ribosomal protein L32
MPRRRSKNKPNATGRNVTTRFARLDHRILHSNAYRALSPNARSLLVELTSMENGNNNGSLFLSVKDGAHRMGVADLTAASRAFDELQELGFIEMTQDARFTPAADKSRARCWRLTWQSGPGRKAPTWNFMEREPEPKTKARKRMERGQKALKAYRRARDTGRLPVLDSNTICPHTGFYPIKAVAESNTPKLHNGGFQPKCRVLDSAIHTAVTMGRGTNTNLMGWFQPDWTPLTAKWAFAAHLANANPIKLSETKN